MSTNSTTNGTVITTGSKTVLESNLDQMFMVLMALLILLMQCGFAFLEAGVVRSKNTTNIVMKNALESCIAGVAYWVVGFAFAFGPGNNFIGWEWFGLSDHPDDGLSYLFIRLAIAAICSTVVSGSVAGRCKMVAYLIYSFIITGFIYPVVTRWVWNTDIGWLNRGQDYEINGVMERIGFIDFSGSGAVLLCGGTAAFVATVILGPRIGRFDAGSELPREYMGHSVPFAGYGGLILLIGFMAFNCGSVMSVTKPGDGNAMGLSVVNTMISAGSGGYSSLFIRRFAFKNHKWSVFNTVNGAVCGMVAICAGCNVVRPWGAIIIGIISGLFYNVTARLVTKAKIDDPANSIAIHFSGGIWGLIATALFKYETGILMAWDRRAGLLLAWQLAGICAIILWTGGLCILLFGIMKYTGVFRVSPEEEKIGSDILEHDEVAYQIHMGCMTPEFLEKLTYLMENMQIPQKAGYIKEGKENGPYEGSDGMVMNNLQPHSLPSHESNVQLAHRLDTTLTKPQGQVNAGYREEVEWTPL